MTSESADYDDELVFTLYDPLTLTPKAQLPIIGYSFNDPADIGQIGSGQFTVPVPDDYARAQGLKAVTAPDETALIVSDHWGSYLWGGIIIARDRPTPGAPAVALDVAQFESWYYSRLFTAETFYSGTTVAVLGSILDYCYSGTGGKLPVTYAGISLEGDVGDELTINPWWTVGQAIDAIAKRDNGFEWALGIRDAAGALSAGAVELVLELFSTGAPRKATTLLLIDVDLGSNKVSMGTVSDDASERATRVWATGEGVPPDQPVTKDEDPNVGSLLLRETQTNWPGVTDIWTLFDHARAERADRGSPTRRVTVNLSTEGPALASYRPGDNCRVRVLDNWDNIDLYGVRILDRAVKGEVGTYPSVALTLDLGTATEGGL